MNGHSEKGRLRTRRREAMAQAFVEAAEAEIGARGYDGATMAGIARVAGCAPGTLYLYFSSKEDLFNAMVTRHVVAVAAEVGQALSSRAGPLERLRRKTAALIRYFDSHQAFFRIFYSAGPGGRAHLASNLREGALAAYMKVKRRETAVLREAQRAGLVRKDIGAAELTEFIHGVNVTTFARWSLAPNPPPMREQEALLWGLVTGGLRTPEEEGA